MVKYADDCSAYIPVTKTEINPTARLNQAASDITQWCDENDMLVNASKSIVMRVNPSNTCNILKDDCILNGISLQEVSHTKVLGVILHDCLNFNLHVSSVVSKVNSKIHVLKILASHGVNSQKRIYFYKACILPTILYAIEAWYGFISEANRQRLERLQNLALKMSFNANPSFSDYASRLLAADLCTIKEFYNTRSSKFLADIGVNESGPLYKTLNNYTNRNRRSSRLHGGSQYTFKARTQLFRKSFFISRFLTS
jgi:hypothetical protein